MTPLVRAASLAERVAYHEAGHVAAALVLGVPIISVTVDTATPAMHRSKYIAPHDLGVEVMATLCLAGPAAEELFCGPITHYGDRLDIAQAREYLARRFEPLWIGAALARHKDAAEKLVRTAWAQQRIRLIADALLQHGTLTGEEIAGLAA